MPIVVKEFSWWQNEYKVFVQVKIPHVSQRNSDVLTSNKYLKVSTTVSILPCMLLQCFYDIYM